MEKTFFPDRSNFRTSTPIKQAGELKVDRKDDSATSPGASTVSQNIKIIEERLKKEEPEVVTLRSKKTVQVRENQDSGRQNVDKKTDLPSNSSIIPKKQTLYDRKTMIDDLETSTCNKDVIVDQSGEKLCTFKRGICQVHLRMKNVCKAWNN